MTAATRTLLPRLAALAVILSLALAGCSSGGGGTGASSRADAAAAATTGQVTVTVQRSSAKTAGLIPSTTTQVRVTVVGTNVVQTVPFPPGATSVQVVLEGVPLGSQTLLVEALDDSGVIASGEIVVEVTVSTVVQDVVVLSPVSPSPSPSPVAGAKLSFTVGPPPQVAAGVPLGDGAGGLGAVEVTVYDASGSVASGATAPITLGLASNAAGATLTSPSGLTAVPSNGRAVFTNLTVSAPATSLALVARTATLQASSTSFDALAAHLVFVTGHQPNPYQQADSPIVDPKGAQLQVAVVDAGNKPVRYAAGTVVATLSPNPGNATLRGGSVPLNNGQASFPAASLNGTGAGYGLRVSVGSLSALSPTFDVAPTTAGGAVFVGASNIDRTAGQLTMYDMKLLQPTTVNLGYGPRCMVVCPTNGGAVLVVGGQDSNLYIYSTTDLTLLSGPITLAGRPEVMVQDPALKKIYMAETGSGNIEIADLSTYPPNVSMAAGPTGLTGVHGLALDTSGSTAKLFDAWDPSVTSLLEVRQPPTTNGSALSTAAASASQSHIDVAPTAQVGLLTFGSAAPPVGFNAVTAAPFGTAFGSANARFDVRFYLDTASSARALIADDLSGQIDVVTLTPQTGTTPTMAVDTAADPNGLIGASGAEFITLGINPTGTAQVLGLVSDPSKSRLLLVDLTTSGKPTIFSQVAVPGTLSPSAITSHQAGFPNTH